MNKYLSTIANLIILLILAAFLILSMLIIGGGIYVLIDELILWILISRDMLIAFGLIGLLIWIQIR